MIAKRLLSRLSANLHSPVIRLPALGRSCVVTVLSVCLISCGGGGGGGAAGGVSTSETDQSSEVVPPGSRVDIAALNLFPMAAGDVWVYNVDGGSPNVTREVFADLAAPAQNARLLPSAASASLMIRERDDYGSETLAYVRKSADGITLNFGRDPDLRPVVAAAIGSVNILPEPLYPQGAVRKSIRSGSFGDDVDGDDRYESFQLTYEHSFKGFETLTFHGTAVRTLVIDSTTTFRVSRSDERLGPYGSIDVERAWYAPGFGMVKMASKHHEIEFSVSNPVRTWTLASAVVGGKKWPESLLNGTSIDVSLNHNRLIYDPVHQMFIASVKSNTATSTTNAVAVIDAATGALSFIQLPAASPDALALSADGTTLYVGVNGPGGILRLNWPSGTVTGSVTLPQAADSHSESAIGHVVASDIAVSPNDPSVIAVATTRNNVSCNQAGNYLYRNLVRQPLASPSWYPSSEQANLLAFAPSESELIGLQQCATSARRWVYPVLSTGIGTGTLSSTPAPGGDPSYSWQTSLEVSAGQTIVGSKVFTLPDLWTGTLLFDGVRACRFTRNNLIVCIENEQVAHGSTKLLRAFDRANLTSSRTIAYSLAQFPFRDLRELVPGPAGTVAIGTYQGLRLFSSDSLR